MAAAAATAATGSDTRTVVAAMGKTGAGAIASGVFSALAMKIVAVVLGPAAIAMFGTLQQVYQAGLNAATLNGQTAVVQGASALTAAERREFLATALRLFALATFLVAAGVMAMPGTIARMAGLAPSRADLVRWLAVPVMLSSAYTFLNALLRVRGRVGVQASIQTIAAMAAAAIAWPAAMAVRAGHPTALVAIMTCSAGMAALSSACALAGAGREIAELVRARATVAAARHFFKISAAVLATGLLSSGVLLAVRAHITRVSGIVATGEFDAAWGISMNHVTLILASMQVYFLPLMARAASDQDRREHIENVLRVAMLAATPIIVVIALAKPLVLTILYSAAFHPAGEYLRWTLAGDYFKVASTVLSTPMLACGDMRAFLTADGLTQAVFFAGAWLLGRWRTPAEAAAMAFVLSYTVNFAVCSAYARRRHGFRLGARGQALIWGGFAISGVACWAGR